MPRPVLISVTASTSAQIVSTPWFPSHMSDPFAIGIGCVVSSSTFGTYSVQHSFDCLYENAVPGQTVVAASAATWFQHTAISSLSSNSDSNYAFPIIGIRLACSASSSGASKTVTMTLIQAGP